LQLGVDYQGGTEDIYKSVKIRIEVGREWQSAANAFNTNALKNLKSLAVAPSLSAGGTSGKTAPKSNIPDCYICLFGVSIRQALFIAPCSHAFHYKCIRPLLESHQPAFSCPLCRTFADLDEDVEVETEIQLQDDEADGDDDESGGEGVSSQNTPLPNSVVPAMPAITLERTRETERERDTGAETEVEADGGGNSGRGRTFRSRANQLRMGPLVDLTEPGDVNADRSGGDDDEEMIDLTRAQSQAQIGSGVSSGRAVVVLDDHGAVLGDDVQSSVHVRGRVDSSEGEGSGSGEGNRGLVGIRMDEGIEDETVGGKRKR